MSTNFYDLPKDVQRVIRSLVASCNRAYKEQTRLKTAKGILVHADGGDCHGTPIENGKCPKCGICPDMQSVEIWNKDLVKAKGVSLADDLSISLGLVGTIMPDNVSLEKFLAEEEQ